MKKLTKKIVISTVLSACALFSACTTPASSNVASGDTSTASAEQNTEKPSIVTTSFHEYDWTRQILGEQAENFDLSFIVDDGVDMHSFQATTPDIMAVSTADLFIYNGGVSEAWITEALEQATNENMISLRIMDALGDNLKNEEIVEGMQVSEHDHAEDEHDHSEDEHDHSEDEHDHSAEAHDHADEHTWLSLNNAIIACEAIAEALGELDSANAELYHENAHAYIEQLEELDAEFENTVANAETNTILFADRFPFLYLVDDYGIDYYAAFNGCSAETEASFETVAFLSGKVTELTLDNVIVLDNSSTDLADTIISNSTQTKSEIITFNSMQSVTKADADNGTTYISIMQENLAALENALN